MSNSTAGNSIVDLKPEGFEHRCMPLDLPGLPAVGEMHVWFFRLTDLARSLYAEAGRDARLPPRLRAALMDQLRRLGPPR